MSGPMMMQVDKCPIWDTPAKYRPRYFGGEELYSPRAGGRYRIDDYATAYFQATYGNNVQAKTLLSLVISDSQQLSEPILLTRDVIERILKRSAARPFEKADRLLRFIANRTSALNQAGLRWGKDVDPDTREQALAFAGLQSHSELEAVLEYLVRKGFCETKINNSTDDEGFVWLTLEGAEEVSSPSPVQSNRGFVAMWFSNETQPAYEFGIAPAIAGLGYQPIRIDQKEHNNKIDDEIISEIRKARFLVADFTCGFAQDGEHAVAVARGGVYFEAGFAMALGIPVFWSCREDLIAHVHFDTRQYNHIVWKNPDDLQTKLRNRIGAIVGSCV